MPEKPYFKDLRDLDEAVEREIDKYLDEHFYLAPVFDAVTRTEDATSQLAGKDIIVCCRI